MFSSRLTKALAALLLVAGLLAALTVSASAAGGPAFDLTPPGGDTDRHGPTQALLPWKHNVVIVHVLDGSGRGESIAPNYFSPYETAPSLAEFASGQRPYVVDWIITTGPDGSGQGDPTTGQGFGGGGVSYYAAAYGRVAEGLHNAGRFCDNRSWLPCDIVLVTYEAPASADHQRHAMAQAISLATKGYNLHTVAVNPNACALQPCVEATPTTPESEAFHARHRAFSNLLGANGYSAVADAEQVHLAIDEIAQQGFGRHHYAIEASDTIDCDDSITAPDGSFACPVETTVEDPDVPLVIASWSDLVSDLPPDEVGHLVCSYPGLVDFDTETAMFADWAGRTLGEGFNLPTLSGRYGCDIEVDLTPGNPVPAKPRPELSSLDLFCEYPREAFETESANLADWFVSTLIEAGYEVDRESFTADVLSVFDCDSDEA